MGAIIQEDGLLDLNDAKTAMMHDGGGSNEWILHLFKNAHTCVLGDVVADFTEADFSSYVPQPIGAFSGSAFGGGVAIADGTTPITWTNSTGAVGNDIYGVYCTDLAGTSLKFSENPPSVPIDMNTAGATIQYIPRMTEENV